MKQAQQKRSQVTDYGISTVTPRAGEAMGTAGFIAPEMLKGESFGQPADVFSFSMVMNVVFGEADRYSFIRCLSLLLLLCSRHLPSVF